MSTQLSIRDLRAGEFDVLGRLMVDAYSRLEGFPTPAEQPNYYEMLAGIGRFTQTPGARVLVAATPEDNLVGGVVYFSDMAQYGSGGIATSIRDASGIRLLGVDPAYQRLGAGRALTTACIELARARDHSQVILHTTQAMRIAWSLYERLGFVRYRELDFRQGELQVFGFRLHLGR